MDFKLDYGILTCIKSLYLKYASKSTSNYSEHALFCLRLVFFPYLDQTLTPSVYLTGNVIN